VRTHGETPAPNREQGEGSCCWAAMERVLLLLRGLPEENGSGAGEGNPASSPAHEQSRQRPKGEQRRHGRKLLLACCKGAEHMARRRWLPAAAVGKKVSLLPNAMEKGRKKGSWLEQACARGKEQGGRSAMEAAAPALACCCRETGRKKRAG
jgi:hypothetical protein